MVTFILERISTPSSPLLWSLVHTSTPGWSWWRHQPCSLSSTCGRVPRTINDDCRPAAPSPQTASSAPDVGDTGPMALPQPCFQQPSPQRFMMNRIAFCLQSLYRERRTKACVTFLLALENRSFDRRVCLSVRFPPPGSMYQSRDSLLLVATLDTYCLSITHSHQRCSLFQGDNAHFYSLQHACPSSLVLAYQQLPCHLQPPPRL